MVKGSLVVQKLKILAADILVFFGMFQHRQDFAKRNIYIYYNYIKILKSTPILFPLVKTSWIYGNIFELDTRCFFDSSFHMKSNFIYLAPIHNKRSRPHSLLLINIIIIKLLSLLLCTKIQRHVLENLVVILRFWCSVLCSAHRWARLSVQRLENEGEAGTCLRSCWKGKLWTRLADVGTSFM